MVAVGTTARNAGLGSGGATPRAFCAAAWAGVGVRYASPTSSVRAESVGAGWAKTRRTYSAPLSRHADLHLGVAIDREACPLNLAPTASTTATLALGDALAMALLEARGAVETKRRSQREASDLPLDKVITGVRELL